MARTSRLLTVALLLLMLPGCKSDKNSTITQAVDDPITGTWVGKFSNGISITAPLTLSGTTIGGTFNTGDTQGTVSGTYTATTFNIQFTKTSATGTQRTLSATTINSTHKRITGNWADTGGLTGTFCLAAPATPACP